MKPASTGAKRGGSSGVVATKPAVRSCLSCRQKHKKCDGQEPCGYCVRLGQPERCLFSVPNSRLHGPKPTEDLSSYAQRLLSEIEVQKQVAQYWKEQFMAVVSEKSRLGTADLGQIKTLPQTPSTPYSSPTTDDGSEKHSPTVLPYPFHYDTSGNGLSPQLAVEICYCSLIDFTPFIPEFEILSPSPSALLKAWYISPKELHDLFATDPGEVCLLFHRATVSLFGASHLGKSEIVQFLLAKAESMLVLLVSNNLSFLEVNKNLVKPMIYGLLMMDLFCLLDPSFSQKLNLHLVMFDISSRFSDALTLPMLLKIHYSRITLARTLKDANYWFDAAVALACPPDKDLPQLLHFFFATISHGYKVLHHLFVARGDWASETSPITFSQIVPEEIYQVEKRLLTLEAMLGVALSFFGSYQDFYAPIEDSTIAVRFSAIIQRSGLCLLLNSKEEALNLMEAFCLALQIARPSITMLVYSVFCAVEIAIALNSPRHVFAIAEYLNSCSCCLSGMGAMRARCSQFLSQVDEAILKDLHASNPFHVPLEQRRAEKKAIQSRIAELVQPVRPETIPIPPEQIAYDVSELDILLRRVVTSLQQFFTNIQFEASQLLSTTVHYPQANQFPAHSTSSSTHTSGHGASAVTVTLSDGLVEVVTDQWAVTIFVRQFDNTTKTWQRLPNFQWTYNMDRVIEYWSGFYDYDMTFCRNASCIPLPYNYSLTDPAIASTAVERDYNVSMPGGAIGMHHERKVTLPNGAKFIQTFSSYDRTTYKNVAGWKLPLGSQGIKIVTRVEDWPPTTRYPTQPSLPWEKRSILALGRTYTRLLPRKDATLLAGYDLYPFFVYQTRPLPDPVQLPAPTSPILNFDLAFRHRFFNLTIGFLQNATRCPVSTDDSTCTWNELEHAGLADGSTDELYRFLFGQVPLNFDVDETHEFRTGLNIGMSIGNDSTVEWDPNLDIMFASDYSSLISSPAAAGAPGSGLTGSLQAENSAVAIAIGVSIPIVVVAAAGAIIAYVVMQRRKKAATRDQLNRLRQSSLEGEYKAGAKPAETAPAPKAANVRSTWEKPATPSGIRNTVEDS